ncbi:MAG: hypothetical protein CVT62_08675 [Actinobacteria bacterium HGW-Actinobacteria-2]|nr:MAG: hypothetical protein CVT62_08675 [Actinobacteria bacterium HGW-Actinobacteria-2]
MTQLEDDLDLEILRSINADVVADADALARVRKLVAATPPRRTVSTWPKLVAVAVAALAVGVGVAMVVPRFTGPAAPSPTSSQTVATFTAAAASANLLRTPLGPTAGQYRKVVARDISSGGQVVVIRDDGTATPVDHPFRIHSTVTTWVPGDPTRLWVRTMSTTLEPVDDAARRYQKAHPDTMGTTTTEPVRAANGDFNAAEPAEDGWLNPSQEFLNTLPRDPAKLLESARAWNTAHYITNDPQSVLEVLARPLADNWIEDAELRAALFTAIGQIDGVQLTPDATIADQRGTLLTGLSQTIPELRTEVLFDPTDYRLLAWRFVNDREGSVTTSETSFSSTVVDSAP